VAEDAVVRTKQRNGQNTMTSTTGDMEMVVVITTMDTDTEDTMGTEVEVDTASQHELAEAAVDLVAVADEAAVVVAVTIQTKAGLWT